MRDSDVTSGTRLKIFISYSRRNLKSAEYLRDRLIDEGFDAYLDKHDILPGEPWQERLAKLIQQSDSIVFLLSPFSVASETCDWEVNEAERLGKRILPVVVTDADPDKTPRRLKRLNYIFMRTPEEVAAGLVALSEALLTDIDWIREHTRLSELVHRWEAAGTPVDQLLRGDDLASVEAWAVRRPTTAQTPSSLMLDFIAASRAHVTKMARRETLRTRLIAAASLSTAIIMAVLGWSYYTDWQASLINQSRSLAASAIDAASGGDIFTAQLLAVEALPDKRASWFSEERWRPYIEEDWGLFTSGMLMRLFLGGHGDAVKPAIYSPDGERIFTGSLDGSAKLWDTNGNVVKKLDKHDGAVWDAVFRHDGHRIATASGDGAVRLWTGDGELLVKMETGQHLPSGIVAEGEPPPSLSEVAFSPDGNRIVAVGMANEGFLWDGDGRFLTLLKGHEAPLQNVVFSTDGRHILTASSDWTARLWTSDGRPIMTLDDHTGIVWTARFDPSGERILTASDDGMAMLWGLDGGRIETLAGHKDGIWIASFTPDGDHIVTASRDGTARLWQADGKPIGPLDGYHEDAPTAITFSRDGDRMIISATFGATSIFETDGTFLMDAGTYGQTVGKGAEFSPDGRSVLGPSGDGATVLEYVPDPQTFIERIKETVPVCLPTAKRQALFLPPDPPSWCLSLGKPPYGQATSTLADWQEPLIERVLAGE